MAGVKGRSGPPRNLNASQHHWRSFFNRLALREEDIWVRSEVRKYAAGLMSDKADPSEGERHAIELAAEAKAARLLIWSAIAKSGFTRQSDEGLALTPAAEALPKFIGAELGALKLLGLERRAKSVGTLPEYLETFATDQATEDAPQDGAV
jgi:hypothetical protein